MSVSKPDAESGPRTPSGLPAFQVARRGYDRQQVEAYVTDLAVRLEEATDRVARVERAKADLEREVAAVRGQAPPTFEELGAEAAMVLEQAGRSAELLLEKARSRADTVVKDAEQVAERVRAKATDEAQAELEAARAAAERVRQEVRQEQSTMHSETEQVREFRDGLLNDLGRAHADIAALLDRARGQAGQVEPGPEPAADAEPASAAADGEPSEEAGAPARPEPAGAAESR
jgi:cell division septum initiation protein DivIVA